MTDPDIEAIARRFAPQDYPAPKRTGLDWFVTVAAPACVLLTILMVLWLVVLVVL